VNRLAVEAELENELIIQNTDDIIKDQRLMDKTVAELDKLLKKKQIDLHKFMKGLNAAQAKKLRT